MSTPAAVKYNYNLRQWYVYRDGRYLHADGVWRETASLNRDGGGLFDSWVEAEKALQQTE